MDALLMCGGRGTRLAREEEKPLVEIGGQPMVDRVRKALCVGGIDTVYAVTSPYTPGTVDHVEDPVIEAPGAGYVADLQYALKRVDPPVLTAGADLPLLAAECIDMVLDMYEAESLTVYVPADRKQEFGVSVGSTYQLEGRSVVPAGVNIVRPGTDEDTLLTDDVRFVINVNRPRDVRIAEAFL